MALSSLNVPARYSANSITQNFTYPYMFLIAADLNVYVVDADGTEHLQTITTDYSVVGTYDPLTTLYDDFSTGGSVNFVTAPASGKTVVIIRNNAETQETIIPVFPETETAFDKLTMLVQYLKYQLTRAVKLSDANPTTTLDLTLPNPMPADSVIATNSGGTGLTTKLLSTLGGGGGGAITVGALDSQTKVATGSQVISSVLYEQTADATNPGLVSTGTQTLAGAKTFTTAPVLSSLTASQAVVTDASKNAASMMYTPSNAANTLVQRNIAGNASFNNILRTMTTIVATGQTIAMNYGSAGTQLITGSGSITFNLPDATYLTIGTMFEFNNNSTGLMNIYEYDGVTAIEVGAKLGEFYFLICTDNSTQNGVWDKHLIIPPNADWSTYGLTLPGYLQSNNHILGYSTTATAGTTTTLVDTSAQNQFFTGSSGHTVVMPAANTLTLGQIFKIINNSSASITVNANGGGLLQTMATLTWAEFVVTDIGSGPGVWDVQYSSAGGGGFTNPMTTLGDTLYEDATPAAARLAGNTTATKKFLTQTGNGSISAVPGWDTIASGDVPTLNQNTSGSAGSVSGTNVVTNSNLSQMGAHTFKGNNTGSTANAADLTATQLTAELNAFTTSLQGVAPSSGGGTANYLRADGTWATPPGTGGSATSTPTASTTSQWDANVNMSANNFISGYRTTATASGTTTLVVGDKYQQYFTGTQIQTVVMPVVSTLVLGHRYLIVNNSTGIVTVQSSGTNNIQAMSSGTQLMLTVISTSGTDASSWLPAYSSIVTGPSSPSEIFLTGGNGYGATNTKIRRWTTTVTSTGIDLTYTDSAADGGSVLINTSGVYAITRYDGINSWTGLSRNSTQLTTNIYSITNADRLALNLSSGATVEVSTVLNLVAGDIIRGHDDVSGTPDTTNDKVSFRIARVLGPAGPVGPSAQTAVFNETQSSGTFGNNGATGATGWNKRFLNTTQTGQPWASLSVDQITLSAGTYLVHAICPAYNCGYTQPRLQNITDASTGILGKQIGPVSTLQSDCTILGTITITSSKVFEVQQNMQTGGTSGAYGIAGSFGDEIFATIAITKQDGSLVSGTGQNLSSLGALVIYNV
jgi:hypothetical protein